MCIKVEQYNYSDKIGSKNINEWVRSKDLQHN